MKFSFRDFLKAKTQTGCYRATNNNIFFIFAGTILKGKEEVFAKSLHELAKEPVFNCMNFESLINDIRTHVAEVRHSRTDEPRSEKTGLRGFPPGPTQTRLYSHTI